MDIAASILVYKLHNESYWEGSNLFTTSVLTVPEKMPAMGATDPGHAVVAFVAAAYHNNVVELMMAVVHVNKTTILSCIEDPS